MGKGQRASLAALLAVSIGTATAAILADRVGLTRSAQAQSDDEKKKRRDGERQKAVPARPQPQPPPAMRPQPPQPRAAQPPPSPPKPSFQQRTLPQPEKPAKQFQQTPPPAAKIAPGPTGPKEQPELQKERFKRLQPQPSQQGVPRPREQPPAFQQTPPPAAKIAPAPTGPKEQPEPQKERFKRFQPQPSQQGVAPRPAEQPPALQKTPPFARPSEPTGPATGTPTPQRPPFATQGPAPKRLEELRKGRIERVQDGGRLKVIRELDNRVIIKQDNRIVVRSDFAERFRRRPGARTERRGDGSVETFYVRRDGVRIVTVVDANGRLLRRYRRDRDGHEHNIIDNRRFRRNVGIAVGLGVLGIIALNLPPPRVTIPYEDYIVDYDRASDDDLFETLDAPPIEDLDRAYSLDEILDNHELRARVRSVDIDTIYFEFGSWEVTPDQYGKLERIARAILRVLERNPEAVFLIAAHTDAVGSDEDNASLSERRATAVADVLSDEFGVPEENLVTQGYGEQYLKIDTQGPEPRNRRVSVQNITKLMAER